MINLNILLEEIKSNISAKLPEAIVLKIEESIQDLKKSQVGKDSLKVGDTLPSFSLPNIDGDFIQIDSILKENKYVLLSFYRGTWCPYCNMELQTLQKVLPLLKNKGASVVAISPQSSKNSQATFTQNAFDFDILVDQNNEYAKSIGISFDLQEFMRPYYLKLGINLSEQNENTDSSLPIPATFVVDKNRTIIYSFVDADYSKRVDMDDLLNSL